MESLIYTSHVPNKSLNARKLTKNHEFRNVKKISASFIIANY